MRLLPLLVASFAVLSVSGRARATPCGSPGDLPCAWGVLGDSNAIGSLADETTVALPLADVEKLVRDHADHLGPQLRNTKYITPEEFGGMEAFEKTAPLEFADGSFVWLRRFRSPAVIPEHLLVFDNVELPLGAELIIFSPSATRNFRRCSHSCMHVTSETVPASGKLTTTPMEGREVVLMYVQPPGLGRDYHAQVDVLYVMQGFGDMLSRMHKDRQRRKLLSDDFEVIGTDIPVHSIQQNTSETELCTRSISCDNTYARIAPGVVAIYCVDPVTKTSGLCTGSIVNAPLGNRYLLTADHCLRDKTRLLNFEFWLLIFNFQTACNATDVPPITEVIQGTRMLFYNTDSDILLLAVPGAIPDHFQAYHLGFDASMNAVPTSAVVIHQPDGSPKSISYVNSSGISTNFTRPTFPAGEIQPTDITHLQVAYSGGSTQGGSSGAPLIDAQSQLIVGVLSGGHASCDDTDAFDYYGRLAVAWNSGLYQYLSGKVDLHKGDSFEDPSKLNLHANDTLPGVKPEPHGPTIGLFPTVLHFDPNNRYQNITYYLTDEPDANDTITLLVTAFGLQGNAINVEPLLQYDKGVHNLTRANYGQDYTTRINVTGWDSGPVPDNLLRFILMINVTSSAFPSRDTVITLKGIIQQQAVTWSDWQAAAVPPLPFQASKTQNPVTSPSGRAIFKLDMFKTAGAHSFVDVLVCREPEPNNLPLSDGTITCYRNTTFIWTIAPDRSPFGSKNCIYVPRTNWEGGNTYYIVSSDSDDFNAVTPMSTLTQVYIAYTNASNAVALLQPDKGPSKPYRLL
ncbi:hypothetical protein CVIRNUC_000551 [Coccomyxa viridis]|uniref:Peptidase S1 domain-containing protein n=1 Tax=Coccomyxa viridis TaxID=1274662 RepID=A0AAV1HRG0_9CHLO|nr:hypothetical protein CVIRNUC_000551 [Coccomyxa viridis]